MEGDVMLECKAVIFDLDGTLVDSSACIEEIWKLWCSDNNINYNKLISVSHGRPTLETMQDFLPSADKKMTDWFLKYELARADNLKLITGAKNIIEKLPVNSWAIATSGVNNLAIARIKGAGLPLPNALITADKIKKGKPDPESFIKAADLLGVKINECVIFEDSIPGILAGHASNAKVVGVKTHLKEKDMPGVAFSINDYDELELNVEKINKNYVLKFNKKI
jgi:mannitol-1-/sugar-/sorbitol-6-phosphatase